MEQHALGLPEYPCQADLWDRLASEARPIVVYGMGNGADKLIRRFEKYNIKISDFFASDGFVRGHRFHGKRVKSFSEIKSEYDDFVIVLSFASNREDVLKMLSEIDRKYEMIIPDMPVAGEDEYFDKEFYNNNYKDILKAYNALDDELSRKIYASIVNYKLTGKMNFLMDAYCTKDEMYSILPCESIRCAIDAGAYNGDTAREMKTFFPNLKKIVAIEPDTKNYAKLLKYSEAESRIKIACMNCAAWNMDCVSVFESSGNRNSTAVATASYQHKNTEIRFATIDSIADGKIDYIKYDVEGGEREALTGSENTILTCHPAMLVSVYHRSRDIFFFINQVNSTYNFYRIYLRRLKCVPAWELNLILVPKTE